MQGRSKVGAHCADVVTDGWSPVSGWAPVLNPKHRRYEGQHKRNARTVYGDLSSMARTVYGDLPSMARCTGIPNARCTGLCPRHNAADYADCMALHATDSIPRVSRLRA